MAEVLSNRVLNRTLLARQHLLERTQTGVADLLEHLVGMQAQDVVPPFVGLWSRIADFDPEAVSAGLDDRSMTRITLMRGTIHLVTARDALRIAPHIQPELEKIPFRKGFFFGATVGMDPADVRSRGETLLGDQPISAADLRKRVAAEWPDRDAQAVVQALLYLLPVLQTPPRGKWKCNNRPVWSRIEPWLGASLDNAYPVDELILRYLQAFGPASTMDMQTWSKLVGLKEVVERLGDRIRTYTDENGRTLYDAADGLLADPDEPAPVRYLGWYDNVFLSHKDRSRIVPEAQSPALRTLATNSAPVLLDGFAAGLYKIHVEGETATLRLTPSVRLSKRDEKALESEALRLVGFLEQGRTPAFEIVE